MVLCHVANGTAQSSSEHKQKAKHGLENNAQGCDDRHVMGSDRCRKVSARKPPDTCGSIGYYVNTCEAVLLKKENIGPHLIGTCRERMPDIFHCMCPRSLMVKNIVWRKRRSCLSASQPPPRPPTRLAQVLRPIEKVHTYHTFGKFSQGLREKVHTYHAVVKVFLKKCTPTTPL